MAKPTWAQLPQNLGGVMRFWKSVNSLQVAEITQEAERPFTLYLVGPPDLTSLLAARLALETLVPRDSPEGPPNIRPYLTFAEDIREVPKDAIVLLTDAADESKLAAALTRIVVAQPKVRLALARAIPAFRPAVVTSLINEASWDNAKIAVISALPGILPLGDLVLPATALGDMLLLTRNQGILLLKISAAYGLAVDLRARSKELLPIVGSAFGWRAIARELIGLVPGGIGVVVKGSVAYAGTYTVGRAAAIYYSTGQTLSNQRLKQLYQDALGAAMVRVKQLLRRKGAKRIETENTGLPDLDIPTKSGV